MFSHFKCKPRLDTLYPLIVNSPLSRLYFIFFPTQSLSCYESSAHHTGIFHLFAFPGFPKHVYSCLLPLSVAKAICFARYLRRMKTFSFPMCPIRSHTRPHRYGLGSTGGASGHTIASKPGHPFFYPVRSSDLSPQCSGSTQFSHGDGDLFMHEPRWFSAEIYDAYPHRVICIGRR